MNHQFKKGDRVRCINARGTSCLEEGLEYSVAEAAHGLAGWLDIYIEGSPISYEAECFELVRAANVAPFGMTGIANNLEQFVAAYDVTYPNGKVYIAGPMSGIAEYNFPAFTAADATLREMGYDTINPATLDEAETDLESVAWSEFLRRDVMAFLADPAITGVVLIDGWRNSKGATFEAYVASTLDIPVYELEEKDTAGLALDGYVDDGWTFFPSIDRMYRLAPLDLVSVAYEAQGLVLGARRYTYGHPLDNFQRIADLWTPTITDKLKDGATLDVRDVAMLMIQLKIAREYNSPKADNQTDTIGYALAYEAAKDEHLARGNDLSTLFS